jgi:hypothetical protein
MLELQVPLLAAKALLLLLLFAFIYAVVRRSVGDLRRVPDEGTYEPVSERNGHEGRPASMAELVVEDSDVMAPETRFPVKSDTTTLGRSSASDIILKSDDYASGRHALLTRHGGLLYVEDAGSTNGTYVNGRKTVGATLLRNGDSVRVGSTTFRYVE